MSTEKKNIRKNNAQIESCNFHVFQHFARREKNCSKTNEESWTSQSSEISKKYVTVEKKLLKKVAFCRICLKLSETAAGCAHRINKPCEENPHSEWQTKPSFIRHEGKCSHWRECTHMYTRMHISQPTALAPLKSNTVINSTNWGWLVSEQIYMMRMYTTRRPFDIHLVEQLYLKNRHQMWQAKRTSTDYSNPVRSLTLITLKPTDYQTLSNEGIIF